MRRNLGQCVAQIFRNYSTKQYLIRRRKAASWERDIEISDYGVPDISKKRLYSFGFAETGALGLPRLLKPKSPHQSKKLFMWQPVRNEIGQILSIKDAVAGHGFSIISCKPSQKITPLVFGCGLNHYSQLGYQSVRPNAPLGTLISIVPLTLPSLASKNVLAIGAGLAHTIISVEGTGLVTLGDNSQGQCGRKIIAEEQYFGSKYVHVLQMFASSKELNVTEISSRFYVTFCVTANGKVFSFGSNSHSQLGRGKFVERQWEPNAIQGEIKSEKIIKVETNGNSAIALSDRGDLFCWGDNESGTIYPEKPGTTIHEPTWVKLSVNIGKVVDIAISSSATFILNDCGDVYVWGSGNCLGVGPRTKLLKSPQVIPPPLFGKNDFSPDVQVSRISSGFFYASAINSIGDLYTWGEDVEGCLGLGNVRKQPFPLKVALGASAIKASLGVDHTLVVTKGGF